MKFPTLTAEDFDVFTIPGLEPRMNALIRQVRPKLQQIGDLTAPWLSAACGEPMFVHVAKHARRTINPPNDSWVAWSNNKRGYKSHPHFQVGLWSTHVFIQFAIIYECTHKNLFAEQVLSKLQDVRNSIPDRFFWSGDHMDPSFTLDKELSDERLSQLIERLKTVKKAEILCGLELRREDARLRDPEAFSAVIEDTFEQLLPLYRLAF